MIFFDIFQTQWASVSGLREREKIATFNEFSHTENGRMVVSNPALPLEYYSLKLIESQDAKIAFVLPDKKPLPNVV